MKFIYLVVIQGRIRKLKGSMQKLSIKASKSVPITDFTGKCDSYFELQTSKLGINIFGDFDQ